MREILHLERIPIKLTNKLFSSLCRSNQLITKELRSQINQIQISTRSQKSTKRRQKEEEEKKILHFCILNQNQASLLCMNHKSSKASLGYSHNSNILLGNQLKDKNTINKSARISFCNSNYLSSNYRSRIQLQLLVKHQLELEPSQIVINPCKEGSWYLLQGV